MKDNKTTKLPDSPTFERVNKKTRTASSTTRNANCFQETLKKCWTMLGQAWAAPPQLFSLLKKKKKRFSAYRYIETSEAGCQKHVQLHPVAFCRTRASRIFLTTNFCACNLYINMLHWIVTSIWARGNPTPLATRESFLNLATRWNKVMAEKPWKDQK